KPAANSRASASGGEGRGAAGGKGLVPNGELAGGGACLRGRGLWVAGTSGVPDRAGGEGAGAGEGAGGLGGGRGGGSRPWGRLPGLLFDHGLLHPEKLEHLGRFPGRLPLTPPFPPLRRGGGGGARPGRLLRGALLGGGGSEGFEEVLGRLGGVTPAQVGDVA